jgi:glycerophosphoryl diester phosphodiesterase
VTDIARSPTVRLKHLSVLTATAATTEAASIVPARMASAPEGPDLTRVLTVAHRGSSAAAPENTLAAFRLGVEQGSDLIESDVQRSKDGALVLMHDTTLARTTNVEQVFPDRSPWRVRDFTMAEITLLDAGSWKSPEFAGERVPTLSEMVEVVRSTRSGILLEIKSPATYPGIEADVAQEFGRSPGYLASATAADQLVVQSFDWASMRRFKAVQPEVPVGLLGTPPVGQLPELALWADQVNPLYGSFDAAYAARVQQLGMDVLTWTVDSEADMAAVLDRGVDGVITNRPDALEGILRERLVRFA